MGSTKNSKFDIETQALVTGVTPATLIGTNGIGVDLVAYNSSGTVLGAVTPSASQIGAKTASELSTASKYVRNLASYFLSELLSAYPTARYLALAIGATSALGAGYTGAAMKYEL